MAEVNIQELQQAINSLTNVLREQSKLMGQTSAEFSRAAKKYAQDVKASDKSVLQQVRRDVLTSKASLSLERSFKEVGQRLRDHSLSVKNAEKLFRVGTDNLDSLLKKDANLRERRLRLEEAYGKMSDKKYQRLMKNLEREEAIHESKVKQVETNVEQYKLVNEKLPDLKNKTVEITKQFILGKIAFANFIRGMIQTYDVTKSALKFGHAVERGTTVIGGLADMAWDAIRLGLSPEDYVRLTAENRQAVLVMGGTNKAFAEINKVATEYVGYIGDLEESSRFLYGQMTTLGRAGITPSTKNLSMLAGEFNELRLLTGLTATEFGHLMDDLTQNQDINAKLQAATEQERKTILLNIATRVKENVAMGMSIQQATEAAKALGRLAAETPGERIKKGARLAALAGAMGIEGGSEILRLQTLGQRRTGEQDKRLQQLLSATQGAVARTAMGPLGSEFAARTLSAGFEDVVGPSSPFQTVLTKALAPDGDLIKNTSALGSESSWLGVSLQRIQQAVTGLTSPLVGVIGGALGGLINIGQSILLLLAARKIGAIGGMGGGMFGKGTKGLGKLGRFARGGSLVGLGLAGASMLAPEEGVIGKVLGSNAALYAGLGATAGSFIPGLGTLAGGALGGVAGGAVDLYDYLSKDKGEEPSSSDVTTTVQNLDTINTTMQDMRGAFEKIASNTSLLVELNKRLSDLSSLQLQATTTTSNEKQRIYEQGRRIGKMSDGSQPYVMAGYA